MCGRFAHDEPLNLTAERWGAALASGAATWIPSTDIRPTQPVPVLLGGARGVRLGIMRWGWPRDFARSRTLINARAEDAAHKPTFAEAWARRRCLVPFLQWYEWQAQPGTTATIKQRLAPLAAGPWAFAGLWEPHPAGGAVVIATVAAHASVAAVHARMPAILGSADGVRWLGGDGATLAPVEAWFEAAPA